MTLAASIMSRHSLHAVFGLDGSPMAALTDDDLLKLGAHWAALHAERMAGMKVLIEAEERYDKMKPDFPSALIKTEADAAMALCFPQDVGGSFERAVVKTWRDKKAMQFMHHARPPNFERLVPWPEKQARANEIIAAWDQYEEDIKRASVETGFEAEEAKDCALCNRLHDLEDKIVRMPAVSLAGLLLKAIIGAVYSCVQADGTTPDLDKRLTRAIEDQTDRDDICALSILRDLYNIGVLGA